MTHTSSPDRLASRASKLLGVRHPIFAAAALTADTTTIATRGTSLETDFEIASISKAVTGLLYADAIGRGEVSADSTLGELLPLGEVPAASVSLGPLSTHRSGLPRLPKSMHPWRRTFELWRHGRNPYGESLVELLDQARGVSLGRARPRYSNFGFELLGHALASAAGTTYADLVQQRIAKPLDLATFYAPADAEGLRPSALVGRNRRGSSREPWTGEAIGPAGGIRASISDMAHLGSALLNGTAPGMAALDPVEPFGATGRIGAGWITSKVRGRSVTWHNGGSGGFRSWLGLDPEAGAGVVILSATSISVDRHGFTLLAEQVRDQ